MFIIFDKSIAFGLMVWGRGSVPQILKRFEDQNSSDSEKKYSVMFVRIPLRFS
jgi:hypothetical protein